MSRNASRVNQKETLPTPEQNLSYSSPTTHVPLPSGGKFYPPEHPLYEADTVEVKQMTTREEEILTSTTLIQKGLMVDRLVKSVLVDKSIEPKSLIIGDKNAILVALRVDAYGPEYGVEINCPACGTSNAEEIDLSSLKNKNSEVEATEGVYTLELPRTGATIEIRPLNGYDEEFLAEVNKKASKYNLQTGQLVNQYKRMVVSVNGETDPSFIEEFLTKMPAYDSRLLRKKYKELTPDVDMSFNFQCDLCGHESGLEVPITAKFFWTD